MLQQSLFKDDDDFEQSQDQRYSLGSDLYLDIHSQSKGQAILYRQGCLVKSVNLSDKVAKKMFVIEVVNLGAKQTKLSEALGISRQTIHNYRETYKYFGTEGLIYSYDPDVSKSLAKQRALHAEQLPTGNKAEQVAAIRADQRQQEALVQMNLNFSFGDNDRSKEMADEEQPFFEQHDWEFSRYAGVFIYWIPLIFHSHWLQLIMGHFGAK